MKNAAGFLDEFEATIQYVESSCQVAHGREPLGA